MSATLDAVLVELRALRADFTALAAHLDARRPVLSEADAALLAAIAASARARAFSSRELWRHADELRGPLWDALTACGLTNARTLGKRLRRIHARQTGRLRLDRIGRDGDGALWCVTVDDDAPS